MKQILLVLCVLSLGCLPVSAQTMQQRGVPAVVLNAFQQQFPKARDVEWERMRDGNYEVEFDNGVFGRDNEVIISPEGKLLRHQEDLTSSSLPDAVKKKIKEEFSEYRVDGATKVDADGTITYEVELERRQGDLKVVFAADGTVVKERMD